MSSNTAPRPLSPPSPSTASSSSFDRDAAFDRAIALSTSLLADSEKMLFTTSELQGQVARLLSVESPARVGSLNEPLLLVEEDPQLDMDTSQHVPEGGGAPGVIEGSEELSERGLGSLGQEEKNGAAGPPVKSRRTRPRRATRKPELYRPGISVSRIRSRIAELEEQVSPFPVSPFSYQALKAHTFRFLDPRLHSVFPESSRPSMPRMRARSLLESPRRLLAELQEGYRPPQRSEVELLSSNPRRSRRPSGMTSERSKVKTSLTTTQSPATTPRAIRAINLPNAVPPLRDSQYQPREYRDLLNFPALSAEPHPSPALDC